MFLYFIQFCIKYNQRHKQGIIRDTIHGNDKSVTSLILYSTKRRHKRGVCSGKTSSDFALGASFCIYTSQNFYRDTHISSFFFFQLPDNLTILHPQMGGSVGQLSLQKVNLAFKILDITFGMRRFIQVPPFLKHAKFSISSQFVKNHLAKYPINVSKTTSVHALKK